MGNFLGDFRVIILSMVRCAPLLAALYHHQAVASLPQAAPPCLATIFYMSQFSSSTFQTLFNAALQDYEDKTGTSLIEHPLAKKLETCDSVGSITDVLQEQAQNFRESRENDGILVKALNSSVDVLCAPSISSALNEAIGLVVCLKAFIQVACS